jgi:hypothetical protein
MFWVLVVVLLVLVGSVISLDNCVELYIYLCSLYILIIQLDYITYKYSPSLSLSSSIKISFQLHSISIFFTCLLLEECFIPFKIRLDENHSTSKFWVHLVSEFVQKKRCCTENSFIWSLCSRNAQILSCKA